MNILCIYRHYVPDTAPYGTILKVIAEHLVTAGHQVSVVSAQPSYNDQRRENTPRFSTIGGVDVIRLPLLPERRSWRLMRAVNMVLFQCQALLYAVWKRKKYSTILINSTPAIASGFTARCIKALTGQKLIYHCQDLHPEALKVSGKLGDGRLFKALRAIDRSTCLAADRVIAISEDMRQSLHDRQVPISKIDVIPNFGIFDSETVPSTAQGIDGAATEIFDILFAGNLGEFQNLDLICQAALHLKDEKRIRWIFMGEGAAKRRLQEFTGSHANETIQFRPYQPAKDAFEAMQKASLGLVPLGKDVYRVAFPSKTAMYLEAGCPLFAVVEEESELAKMIKADGLGYTSAATSAEDIAAAVLQAFKERAQWTPDRRQQIRETGRHLFGRESLLKMWLNVFPQAESKKREVSSNA